MLVKKLQIGIIGAGYRSNFFEKLKFFLRTVVYRVHELSLHVGRPEGYYKVK
tara:strand:+ start:161 stop:316 length:156 start_codon:yes stop_codon:yes gene_type:complete